MDDDDAWRALAPRLALPSDWSADERKRREATIDVALETWLAARKASEAAATLQSDGIAATPILDLEDVAALPIMRERELVTRVEHPRNGTIPLLRSPLATRYSSRRSGATVTDR